MNSFKERQVRLLHVPLLTTAIRDASSRHAATIALEMTVLVLHRGFSESDILAALADTKPLVAEDWRFYSQSIARLATVAPESRASRTDESRRTR